MDTSSSNLDPMSPEQELAYIRKIIDNSRQALCEDGKPYILWGIIVALGMTVTYISVLIQQDLYTGPIWIGLTLLGYAYILYYVRKKKARGPRVKSIIDRIQGAIWGAVGSSIGLVILLMTIGGGERNGMPHTPHPFYICFFASVLLGIAYFLSGIVLDIKWLRNIGFAWWGGSVVMFLWPSIHVLGLYALMMILFQVVPGIVLNKQYRKALNETSSLGTGSGA